MAIPCAPTGDKQVQLRRGTTAENDAFIGADGELSFDTDQNRLRVHDGVTPGGFPIAFLSEIVAGSSPPFVDTTNIIMGSVDPTKLLRFEVDGFTAGTVRALTPQNASYTIAGLETANLFTANQNINNNIALNTDGTASFAGGLVVIDASGIIDIGGGFTILSPDGSAVFAGGALSIFSTGRLAIADGTAASPGLVMNSDPNTGLYLFGADQFAISTGGLARAVINNSGLWLGANSIQWGNGFGSAVDVILFRDGANLGQRLDPPGAGSGGTQYHLYNNYVDDLNWERVNLEWNANTAFLSTEKLGTGSFRNLSLGSEGTGTVSLRTDATDWYTLSTAGNLVGTKNAIGSTPTDNLQLRNTTAAAAGAQQYSPALRFTGQGWKTTATAASQPVEFRMYAQPVQGGANATGNFILEGSINSGAWTSLITTNYTIAAATTTVAGALNSGAIIATGSVTILSTGEFRFGVAGSGRSILASSADGLIELFNTAKTGFTRLNFGGTTSSFPAIKRVGATFDFRLADDSAYAGFTSGNHTFAVAALLSITSGTNQRAGNAVLVAGTVTVSNTTVTANTIVMITRKTSGGTLGTAITYTVSAGTSFTINSDSALDTSTFSYLLIEVP